MQEIPEVVVEALLGGLRRLGESHKYDPVNGSLFANEDFEVWVLVVVTVLIIGLGSLAAGAGIGGGGLFVPLFAFVLGVGAKAAVPLSKATILGGALGNMLSLAFARHPDPNKTKPLIDYEASTYMQSGELLGVVFGVLLNLLLPEILIIVFLAVLLSFNAYKTLQKGMSKYKDESKKMKQCSAEPKDIIEEGISSTEKEMDTSKDDAEGSEASTTTPPDKTRSNTEDSEGITSSTQERARSNTEASGGDNALKLEVLDATVAPEDVQEDISKSPELQKILDEDAAQFPSWAWYILAPMTTYTVVYAYVKRDVVNTCSPVTYWLWYFSPVLVLSLFMYGTGRILKQKHRRRVEAGYVFHGDGEDNPDYREMKWTDTTLKRFPLIAILAGVAAGLLGIGGGMVIGPLFIQLDMQPKVGSASCAFMILWTALSGVVQYAFAGKLGWQFILYGIVVGFVSGQIGQRGVDHMLKKSGRPSYVIFLLGGIVLVACIAMTCTGTYKLIKGLADGDDIFVFDTYDLTCQD